MSWICCCSRRQKETATTPAEKVALLVRPETPLTQLIRDLGTSTLHAELFSGERSIFGPHSYFKVDPTHLENTDKESLTLTAVDQTTREKINKTITLVLNPANQQFSISGDVFYYKQNVSTGQLHEYPFHFNFTTRNPKKTAREGESGFDFTLTKKLQIPGGLEADTFSLTLEEWTDYLMD